MHEVMKIMKFCFAAVAALVMLASCDQIIGNDGQLIIDPVEDAFLEQTVGSTTLAAKGVAFSTTGAWTSQIVPVSTKGSQPMWVSISPDHGDEAGTYTVTITLEANDTGEDRKADIIITCGEQKITISITQVATEDVPSDGEQDNSKPHPKCVSKIDYRYTDNAYDGSNNDHYTLTYRYDDQNRVVRIEEVCESPDSYNSYERWYAFDYTIADNVSVAKTYKSGGDSNRPDQTFDASIQDGRITEVLITDDEDYGSTYKYTFAYDSNGYLTEIASHTRDQGVNRSGFLYSNGLLSGITGGNLSEGDEGAALIDIDSYYPSRYPNGRTNVDFNVFLFSGDPELYSIQTVLMSLRMCGRWGDCCVEIGGGGIDEYFNSRLEYVNDPNYREHVSKTDTKINDGVWNAVYEFDADGCPVTISYNVVYDIFNIEYDKVADTSESFPYNPNSGDRPGKDEDSDEVWYRVTTKNYKETKTGEIKCPAVYTITYKE